MKLSFEQIIDGHSKVNMLTAIREVDGVWQGNCNRRMVECLCDCGNTTVISIDHYKRSKIVSCGCHHKKITSETLKTHGLSKTAEYKVWQGMKGNPNHADYYNYGTVSDEWRNSFETFITDMGERALLNGQMALKGTVKIIVVGSLQSGNRRKPCKKGTSVNYEIKREGYLKRKVV